MAPARLAFFSYVRRPYTRPQNNFENLVIGTRRVSKNNNLKRTTLNKQNRLSSLSSLTGSVRTNLSTKSLLNS
jgi:hypothetical protein